MNNYELLGDEAYKDGISIIEYKFSSNRIKGLYCDGNIALNKEIETSTEKSCILAEELGHHYTTVGNILNQSSISNRKQELRARIWAYNKLIGLTGIIKSYEHGCQSITEMADYLEVTEEFLHEALSHYRSKYGLSTSVDRYIIYFEPTLLIGKID